MTFLFSAALHEGSPCRLADGSRGQCVEMAQCPSALAEFRRDRRAFRPKRCGFKGFSEVVCCADVPLRRAEEGEFGSRMAGVGFSGSAWARVRGGRGGFKSIPASRRVVPRAGG